MVSFKLIACVARPVGAANVSARCDAPLPRDLYGCYGLSPPDLLSVENCA